MLFTYYVHIRQPVYYNQIPDKFAGVGSSVGVLDFLWLILSSLYVEWNDRRKQEVGGGGRLDAKNIINMSSS